MLQSRPYVRTEIMSDEGVCVGVDVDLGFAHPVSAPTFFIHEHRKP